MPEFRQNPLTGQWVIVAPRRAERPQDFSTARPRPRPAEYLEDCPFCPGHEQQTPPEVYAVRDDYATTDGRGWRVRVVPNKYPALVIDDHGVSTPRKTPSPSADSGPNPPGPEADTDRSPLRAAAPGVGMHEVIVESPAHHKHFALHDDRQAELIIHTLRHRFRMIMQAREVKHVCIIKNHGPQAGASIDHPHFQIIAPAVIPSAVKLMIEREADYAEKNGRPLFEALLQEELAAGERIVATNDEFVSLAPWASPLPFSLWIVPREHTAMFGDLPDNHVSLLAAILGESLLRLHQLLDDPDYHLVIHSSPKWRRGQEVHRWFVEITPRTTTPAGFEFGTGMYINHTPPEQAATALREIQLERD